MDPEVSQERLELEGQPPPPPAKAPEAGAMQVSQRQRLTQSSIRIGQLSNAGGAFS